jgi:hypothetical protein
VSKERIVDFKAEAAVESARRGGLIDLEKKTDACESNTFSGIGEALMNDVVLNRGAVIDRGASVRAMPQAFTVFSNHAFERLAERTRLEPEEVASMLDAGCCVNVGREPGFQREHLLIFSPADKEHFVVVRDNQAGMVVTVLPLEYHSNLAWSISSPELELAKSRSELWLSTRSSVKDEKAQVFLVTLRYLDEDCRPRFRRLLKIPAELFGHSVRKLMNSSSFMEQTVAAIKALPLEGSLITGVSVRLGNKGEPLWIDLY